MPPIVDSAAMDYSVISLEYKHELVVDDDDPDICVKDLCGFVLANLGSRRVRLGRFRVLVIDLDLALNEGHSPFDVFDQHAETVDYWSLYRSGSEFSPKVIKLLRGGDRGTTNMLVLDRVELKPEHRGHGVGLQAIRCLMQQFSIGCGIVVMRPFPLQFEYRIQHPTEEAAPAEKPDPRENEREFKRATTKLRNHYSRLGFVRVPGTDFMIADPFMGVPSLEADHDSQFF